MFNTIQIKATHNIQHAKINNNKKNDRKKQVENKVLDLEKNLETKMYKLYDPFILISRETLHMGINGVYIKVQKSVLVKI